METDALTSPSTTTVTVSPSTVIRENELRSSHRKCYSGIRKRLPILQWLPKYKRDDLIGDFIAGITVGLTAIPQVMAYAVLAGLTPEYGLYSSFIPPFVYLFLGACRQVTIGPTAIIALIAFETCGEDYPECVVLTSFYSGVFELTLSILGLGSAISLISEPVTIGFTTGAALTISSSQLKGFLGLSTFKGSDFIGYWKTVFSNLTSISPPDAILGSLCVIFLVFLQKLGLILKPSDQTARGRVAKKVIWLLSVSRNVLVVLITTTIAYFWNSPPFELTGEVVGGFPSFHFPHFLLPNRTNGSATENETLSFGETWGVLRSGPFVVALVAILQNVAISKIYGSGQRVDGNQEMLALGISKILGSFFSAQPVSGSFSRSAVNEASGVRSPLGGIFTGCLILLSLGFLTSAFYYIPKASLSAIIICAVLTMIEFDALLPMWRISKLDFLICCLTFLTALLLGMEYGIGIGVGFSILLLLYEYIGAVLTPELKTDEESGKEYIVLRPAHRLRFPGVDVIRKYVNKSVLQYSNVNIIMLDCLHWTTLDFSATSAVASLIKGLKRNGKYLILLNVNEMWLPALKSAGVLEPERHCFTEGNEQELITRLLRKGYILPFISC